MTRAAAALFAVALLGCRSAPKPIEEEQLSRCIASCVSRNAARAVPSEIIEVDCRAECRRPVAP